MFGSIKDEKKNINNKGIGLGLVICKIITKKFGGEIDFVSKYKQGTTFYFTFMLEPMELNEIEGYDKSEKKEEQDPEPQQMDS